MRFNSEDLLALPFCGALGLACVAVTLHFLAKDSRFRISQLLLAVFLYGGLLYVVRWWTVYQFEDSTTQGLMMGFLGACLVPLIGYGLDCGARNEEACTGLPLVVRWWAFLSGLVLVFAILALPVMAVTFLVGIQQCWTGTSLGLIAFLFIASLSPVFMTAWCRARAKRLAKELLRDSESQIAKSTSSGL